MKINEIETELPPPGSGPAGAEELNVKVKLRSKQRVRVAKV